MDTLTDRRLLVVGASSGIGRAVGLAAAAGGARVAFSARRDELLEQAAEQAGNGAIAVAGDVREPAACTSIVEETVAAFGGLDGVVYATGLSPLVRLDDADEELWATVLETNLVGAALILRAALPHLREASGRAVVLSSHSVEDPWPGLVPYVVSKTGLDALVRGWRAEHPDVPVGRVVVGPTLTEFASGWDEDLAGEMFQRWADEGRLPADPSVMQPEEVAAEVLHVLTSPVDVSDVRVVPHGGV